MSVSERVCEIIGYEKLEELCKELGGTHWNIPVHPPASLRDERIRQEFDHLMFVKQHRTTMQTYQAVAAKYGVSISKVQKVVSDYAPVQNM